LIILKRLKVRTRKKIAEEMFFLYSFLLDEPGPTALFLASLLCKSFTAEKKSGFLLTFTLAREAVTSSG